MASILVVLTCAVADGFLIYVLVQFARELRRQRLVHTVSAVISIPMPASEKAAEGRDHRKVIDITSRKLVTGSESESARRFLIAGKGKRWK